MAHAALVETIHADRLGSKSSEGVRLGLAISCLGFLVGYWCGRVNAVVSQPYLDEVFHVRQAQTYCAGNLIHWDDKITTPPGLYAISWMLHQFGLPCGISWLRFLNVAIVIFALLPLLFGYRQASKMNDGNAHTAMNICLFPPLFFFTALYYTDVASTTFVMLSLWHIKRTSTQTVKSDLFVFALGMLALSFRQTNIFWVAVFPAATQVVERLKAVQAAKPAREPHVKGRDRLDALRRSWQFGEVFDPPADDATVEDYVFTAVTIALAALGSPLVAIRAALPYVALIAAFGGFVMWNGGVVLGDKSNHVATLHLPQMLYIWPYMIFFSAPLALPHILNLVLPKEYLPSFAREYIGSDGSTSRLPRRAVLALWLAAGLLVVHANTIVHPFTLADNRHYVFYVFRILLRHPALKYLAVPIYLLCGWAVLATLTTRSPFTAAATATGPGVPPHVRVRASFVLAWLATSTLCLVTAPLVEPRYFIVPWLVWRVHVPVPSAPAGLRASSSRREQGGGDAVAVGGRQDHRLWLETAWFCAINGVTGYVFLYQGFAWPQEPGEVQRFMW